MANTLQTRRVPIAGKEGFNLRVATLFSKEAGTFPCDIRVVCGDRSGDAKDLLALLSLQGEPGSELLLEAIGPQSADALDRLEKLLTEQFRVSEADVGYDGVSPPEHPRDG